jgi:hypothetical protein
MFPEVRAGQKADLQPLEGLSGVVEGSVLGDVSAEVLLDEV